MPLATWIIAWTETKVSKKRGPWGKSSMPWLRHRNMKKQYLCHILSSTLYWWVTGVAWEEPRAALSGVGKGCEQRQRCLRGQAFNNDYKLELAAGATGCSCGPARLWSAPRLLQGPRPPCMRRRWNYVAACGKECHATPGWRSTRRLESGRADWSCLVGLWLKRRRKLGMTQWDNSVRKQSCG